MSTKPPLFDENLNPFGNQQGGSSLVYVNLGEKTVLKCHAKSPLQKCIWINPKKMFIDRGKIWIFCISFKL